VWVGWETSAQGTLKTYRASAKQGRNREDAVKKIKDHGIDVTLCVVVGGRGDTADDFEGIIELAERLGAAVHPVLLTPLPGTELYEEYELYLLKDRGWEYYTGAHAVFEHPTMSAEEREAMFYKASLRLLSKKRIIRHLFDIRLKGFPMTHMLSLMKQGELRGSGLK
jgi:radical SAM superfamily enzyme YgiQ (UPF0313 family)